MNVSIKSILNRHPRLCFFLLAIAVIVFHFFVLRHETILKYDSNNKILTYGLRSLADAIILLLPYWILPIKYRRFIWIVIILFMIWTLSQLWYFRTYNDLMPFSSFLLFSNISPLLIESIKASMRAIDWSIIISIILLLISDLLPYPNDSKPIKSKNKYIYIVPLIVFVALVHIANGSAFYLKGKG